MRTRLTNCKYSRLNIGNSRIGLSSNQRSRLNGIPSSPPAQSYFRLLEDGFFRLIEDGSFRLLE